MGFQTDLAATTRIPGGSRRSSLAVAALAIIISAGAALAQPDRDGAAANPMPNFTETAPAGAPKITERPQSLRLEFSARTITLGVVQAAREIMTTGAIPFAPGSWEVTSEAQRAIGRLRNEFRGNVPKGAAFAILVSGGDEVVNYRRARGLRTALIEQQLEEAAQIVIAARATGEGQSGDTGKARVDLVPLDPSRCGGCGSTPFRTIALDTGVSKLVRATAEDVVVAVSTPNAAEKQDSDITAKPLPAPRPRLSEDRPNTVPAPAPQRARAARPEAPALAMPAAPPRPVARTAMTERDSYQAPKRRAARSRAGCPQPDIIIDDYYPGGPLVGCDGSYGPRPRW
ncbi:hypothetical protein [Bosea sp. (in: a-proteobacteria)]|uniref:hypothetical protein n=1 Tax=Bosea sp. (in: a-proteobacteria) TaxID=1871050 RepID=UPI001AD26DE2|nr:hypothetical protein [Bosea sp. (in: a-proteobacteria)]MBN9436880.1 hypothetical protein [Bosea sp. (in: a-proteobacteria)]MBN9469140.1 hypothetical protein [Bosea sp. (in: a-proteobacteria)]